MKKTLQLLAFTLIIFFAQHTQAQDTIINIPDANFKAKLLGVFSNFGCSSSLIFGTNICLSDTNGNIVSKIDLNNDGEIQQSEADKIGSLPIFLSTNDNNVSFIGINAFKNLSKLFIFGHLHINVTQLDINLPKLEFLLFNNYKLTSLSVRNLPKLTNLICIGTDLNSIDLSMHPNLVQLIYNSSPNLIINFNHIPNLKILGCNYNNYLNIDFNKIKYIEKFYGSSGGFLDLDLSLMPNLVELICRDNQLTTLDLSKNPNLVYLDCYDNPQLNTIYMKSGVNFFQNQNYNFYIGDCPNLKYICADVEEIESLDSLANEYGYTNLTINSFCSSSSGGAFYTMKTNTRYDANNNGCTAQDSIFPFLKYLIKNATDSGYTIADAQGNMSLDLNEGTYTIQPIFSHPYFTVVPAQANVTLPEDTLPTNFCITPIGNFNDVTIQIIPTNDARPGFSDATYKIVFTNKGTTTVSGNITFTFQDSIQDFVSSSVVPTSNVNGVVTFAYSNLKPFENRSITINLRTNAPTDNPAINGGDILELQAIATMNTTSNVNTSDDTSIIRQTVVNSFDPNDKRCLEGDIVTPDLVGDFVNYLIRFENEGNANAINIVVTDRIDTTKFDITSLEVTASSHSNRTLITEGNKVQFIFDNINLPFTEPLKHGFIAFQIKTKNNLVIGDSLKNYADIFFDYNLPITTNTAGSRIDTFTRTGGITSIRSNTNKEGKLSIYPNPSNGNFRINFESKGDFPIHIKLIDLNGRIIKSIEDEHQNQTSIDISESQLSNGLYQISIQTDKDIWQQKVMIVK